MAAQIRTFSLKPHQADQLDVLAEELGGMSKAGQHVMDFYIRWHVGDTGALIETASEQPPTPEPNA